MNQISGVSHNKVIKLEIESMVKEFGDIEVGYASAAPFTGIKSIYRERLDSNEACEFEIRSDMEAMVQPSKILSGAKSFVVIVVPYNHSPYIVENAIARMSSGTAGEDYHIVIGRYLDSLVKMLGQRFDITCKAIVDTSPLIDRAIAVRSGLVIQRRNGMCYHKRYGSYFHIGALIIDHQIEDANKDEVIEPRDVCANCRRCVEFCPGKAITGNYTINSNLCASYLSQKKILTKSEVPILGNRIYGCDICQTVCPANQGVKNNTYYEEKLIVNPLVNPYALLGISNKEFKASYGMTSSGWRGKRTLQRNALVALGNYYEGTNNEDVINMLSSYKRDERPIIAEEATRAINRIKK